MSSESALLVRLPPDLPGLKQLVRDIRAADARARKAMPGERTDIVRVETLSSQLERLASAHAAQSPHDSVGVHVSAHSGLGFIDRENHPAGGSDQVARWIDEGALVVEVRRPLNSGATSRAASLGRKRLPEAVWDEAPDGISSKKAVALRFKGQIQATLEDRESPAFIEPSGVSNSVLTETLRDFVTLGGGDRVNAPVRYQDGSVAEPFPLRSLTLLNAMPDYPRLLRLALLSIRHTEMDVEVDGCWLRNFDISRPRPAAETDQLAFQLSQTQLATLTQQGPLLIHLYQTGLDPAVVGFYRAVVHQLIDAPGSVAVLPKYFRHPPPPKDDDPAATVTQVSYFAEGKPWAV